MIKVQTIDKSETRKYSKKHQKILNFLRGNGGKNLESLESNLEDFSESDTTPHENNEDLSSLSVEDELGKLFEYDFIPHLSNDIDLTCFDGNSLVIVEIKSPSEWADSGTFGQILYYMIEEIGYINEKKASNQTVKHDGKAVKNVRGIILAHNSHIRPSLRRLLKAYEDIRISLKQHEKLPNIILRTYHCTDKKEPIIDAL